MGEVIGGEMQVVLIRCLLFCTLCGTNSFRALDLLCHGQVGVVLSVRGPEDLV